MKNIPNALTLANLFCGCCALLYTFYWQPVTAAFFTAGCFVFDYLDGLAARGFKVNSPIGKELDSLADMVSFGVVPGAMLYHLLSAEPYVRMNIDRSQVEVEAMPAFVLTAFSALRLAKFNLDTRQTNYFIGLSTPACTLFVLGLVLAAHHDRFGMAIFIGNHWFLYGIIAMLSWLLVSEIPMFGMKIKLKPEYREFNWANWSFLAIFPLLGLLALGLQELALSAIVIIYILWSIVSKNKIIAS